MTLNEQQVDFIDQAISKEGLRNKSLQADLLDHMCCLVEMEMQRGLTFEQAYQKAYFQTAPTGFVDIQNETIFLLNYNKLLIMKRFIYLSGYLFATAWVIGIFFKLMHLPGAMILMFGGGTGLAFVFLPLLLLNKYKDLAVQAMSEKMKWTLGALSFFLFMVASWMKLAHLMGAGVMLGVSFLVFGFGFLPFLFFRMYKKSLESI